VHNGRSALHVIGWFILSIHESAREQWSPWSRWMGRLVVRRVMAWVLEAQQLLRGRAQLVWTVWVRRESRAWVFRPVPHGPAEQQQMRHLHEPPF